MDGNLEAEEQPSTNKTDLSSWLLLPWQYSHAQNISIMNPEGRQGKMSVRQAQVEE